VFIKNNARSTHIKSIQGTFTLNKISKTSVARYPGFPCLKLSKLVSLGCPVAIGFDHDSGFPGLEAGLGMLRVVVLVMLGRVCVRAHPAYPVLVGLSRMGFRSPRVLG